MNAENPKAVLSKKSINAIAEQVETRLKQDSSKPAQAETTSHAEKINHGGKKLFFWGAASGLTLAMTAPLFSKQARPAVRGAIKGGLLAGRYFQRVASSIKEDVQDLTEEAKSDLDLEKEKPDTTGTPKPSKRPTQ
ncbi:MAG: hypothetical protein QOH35_498 [Acidobacteriaceae bacterium]|jgi:hypothetical protein|nr:hypothetical protein [Acidobacteriaceae bacterium]MEA2539132.1 hypothetical protein [Acidobacteriaceae bacterium]